MNLKKLFRRLIIAIFILTITFAVGLEFRREFQKSLIMTKFDNMNKNDRIIVLSKFLDIVNGDEYVKILSGGNDYFSPSNSTIMLSDSPKEMFTSYIKREFKNVDFSNINIDIFVAFHEMGHSLTISNNDMSKYTMENRNLIIEYGKYKKQKRYDFIAYSTGTTDDYQEINSTSYMNLLYRRISAEKVADLVAFYLYENCYDILLTVMDGDEYEISSNRLYKIKKDIFKIKTKYLM